MKSLVKINDNKRNDLSSSFWNELTFHPIENLLDNLFSFPHLDTLVSNCGQCVYESEDGTTLHLDLPGVLKDDVNITLNPEERNSIIINSKRSISEGTSYTNIDLSNLERTFKFRVKHNIDENGIDATLKDGVLTIFAKKETVPEARRITVK